MTEEKSESGVDQEVATASPPLINSKNRSSRVDTTRANRELDAEIMAGVFKREIEWHRGEPSYITPDKGDGWVSHTTVPRFSLSLVDAFRMAETFKYGWRSVRYASDPNFTVTFYRTPNDCVGVSAEAPTLPLAFCVAALRALDA